MTPDGVPSPAPVTRVEIAAGGHQVVVEAPEPLGVVAEQALDLWTRTVDPNMIRGVGSTVGFTGELAGSGDLPDALTLPRRMIEGFTYGRRPHR